MAECCVSCETFVADDEVGDDVHSFSVRSECTQAM
jgi:hypothetical protein